MNEGQELVEETKVLSVFNKFEADLVEFEKVNEMITFDLDTFEGEEGCKKHIKNIGDVRIGVEKLRKSTKKEFLDGGNAVDKEAKMWQARIAKIDAVHSVPLKALETKRINEVLAEQEAIKAKAREEDRKRIADLEEREAKMAAKEAAQKIKDDSLQAERDAAERKEELEAAALLAAEAATLQAAQDAIDAAAKAKQDLADAIAESERKAKVAADGKAKEIADKYEAEQAEKERQAEVVSTRQADVKHRQQFNRAAANALDGITGDSDISVAVIIAIVSGTIPNVTLNY
jgi:hypothetical protein